MHRIEKLFGGTSMSFEEFSAAAKAAEILILEGKEGSYVPVSREAELLGEIEKAKETHRRDLSRVRAESAVREALLRSGAHNPSIALRAIDLSDMDGDSDGLFSAAEAKAAALRTAEPYLFRTEGVTVSTGASHGTTLPDTDSMSDSEYYRHINLK